MSGAVFILAINASAAALLAGAFLFLARYDRSLASARWMALAFLVGGSYYVAEFLLSLWPDSILLPVLCYASLLSALCLYAVGIARNCGVRPPWRLLAALFVLSIAVNLYAQTLPRELILRNVLWQLPYAAAQAVGVAILLKSPSLGKIEKALLAALMLSTLHFLVKPILAVRIGGPGDTVGDYIDTFYALISQSSGAVIGILVALLTLAVLCNAILSDANRKSETDTLSGLLNRHGFLLRAGEVLAAAPEPVALVLADIDHFKTVNDTHGHEAGDRVIEAFAAILARSAGSSRIVGRIGGEEFAMLLAGTELSTARLVAEGARVALAHASVPGLPDDGRVTASFGVAQWRKGVGYDELFRQADAALYEAKNSGRDCVRVAPPVLRPAGEQDRFGRRAIRDRA